MHILGIGTDIIEIHRIETMVKKWGNKFLSRVFCRDEILYAQSKGAFFHSSLAARFAAKEAVLKALGTGLSGARWPDIEIVSHHGCPQVVLRGSIREKAEKLLVKKIHLSLSHCGEYALAFAVAEGESGE